MIELFTHKQIRCKHCDFEFSFFGFGSAAKIVCPACGEENLLPPVSPLAPQEEDTLVSPLALREAESDNPISPVPAPCVIERCPLLIGGESGETVAEQLGLKLRKKRSRRQTILAWTVTTQLCVLIGIALFISQTLIVHKENTAETPMAVVEPQAETKEVKSPAVESAPLVHVELPTESVTPLLAEPDDRTAALPEDPFVKIGESGYAFLPLERTQDAFPPSVITSIDDWVLNSLPEPAPLSTPSVPAITVEMADELLKNAKESLSTETTAPEDSIEKTLQAIKIYEELKHPLPDSTYWILGNAFASLTWGEALLESSSAVETMTLSPNNRYLIAQLRDGIVWLWDLHSSEQQGYALDQGAAKYVKFLFTPDLRWIIGGRKDGTIRIWDMSLNDPAEMLITFTETIAGLQDLQISPNGQWLAAFGSSPNGVTFSQEHSSQRSVQQVNYQPTHRFGTQDAQYPVVLWNLRQMTSGIVPIAVTIPSMPQPVQVIQFSPNSDRIAVGRRDTVIKVYDLTARGVGDEPFVLQGHQLGITQIAFAPNGEWLATGSQDNTVRLWNLSSSKVSPESVVLYGHVGWISALTIDPSGEYIISGSYDRSIRVWNVKRNRISTVLSEEPIVLETNLGVPRLVVLTHDGDKMIALGNEGSLGIYHFPSLLLGDSSEDFRRITFRNSRLPISNCLLSQDDQLLIFSYEHLVDPQNSGIRLWPLYPQAFVQ